MSSQQTGTPCMPPNRGTAARPLKKPSNCTSDKAAMWAMTIQWPVRSLCFPGSWDKRASGRGATKASLDPSHRQLDPRIGQFVRVCGCDSRDPVQRQAPVSRPVDWIRVGTSAKSALGRLDWGTGAAASTNGTGGMRWVALRVAARCGGVKGSEVLKKTTV